LSNLEGQALLKRIADGTAERAEIMALGQMLSRGVEADMRALDAKIAYRDEVAQTPGKRFSVVEEDRLVEAARSSVPTFRTVHGERDILDLQEMYATEYPVDHYQDFPIEVRGEVVRRVNEDGTVDYVPLFYHEFPGEYE